MPKAKVGQKGQKRKWTPSHGLQPSPIVQESEQAAPEDEEILPSTKGTGMFNISNRIAFFLSPSLSLSLSLSAVKMNARLHGR